MKRLLLFTIVVIAFSLPMAAQTNLINFGYDLYNGWLGTEDAKFSSILIGFTHLGSETSGFYLQGNFYYGAYYQDSKGVHNLEEISMDSGGVNTILGYGTLLDWGVMGMVIGGGLYSDLNVSHHHTNFIQFDVSLGFGLGLNLLVRPDGGNFVFTAGVMAALNPILYTGLIPKRSFSDTLIHSPKASSDLYMLRSSINFTVGIGWSVGGSKEQPSRNTAPPDDGW